MNDEITNINNDKDTLSKEKEDLITKNQELTQQLIPYKTVALEYYPGPESNALALLAQRIGQIELTTMSILDYQEISTWDFEGNVTKKAGEGISLKSGGALANWTNEYITFNNNEIQYSCNEKAIEYYLGVLKKYSLYPFPYFIISECQKKKNNPDWETYRERALELVKKTTTIPNHHPDHDWLLAELEGRIKAKN